MNRRQARIAQPHAGHIPAGPREERRSLYPIAALQQLVRNAVMHRTYEIRRLKFSVNPSHVTAIAKAAPAV